jgi:hypothetical protein
MWRDFDDQAWRLVGFLQGKESWEVSMDFAYFGNFWNLFAAWIIRVKVHDLPDIRVVNSVVYKGLKSNYVYPLPKYEFSLLHEEIHREIEYRQYALPEIITLAQRLNELILEAGSVQALGKTKVSVDAAIRSLLRLQ